VKRGTGSQLSFSEAARRTTTNRKEIKTTHQTPSKTKKKAGITLTEIAILSQPSNQQEHKFFTSPKITLAEQALTSVIEGLKNKVNIILLLEILKID